MLGIVKTISRKHPWLAAEAMNVLLRVGALADRSRIFGLDNIRTHMYKDELYFLYWLSKHLRKQATVLEVGSYLGASACYLAAGLRDGRGGTVVCVDTWMNDAMNEGRRDTFDQFLENVKAFQETILALRGKSVDVAARYDGKKINLLFIDGDHTYEGCHADWVSWRNHLADSSIVAFHDYTRSEGIRQVVEGEVPRTFDITFRHAASSLHVLWLQRKNIYAND